MGSRYTLEWRARKDFGLVMTKTMTTPGPKERPILTTSAFESQHGLESLLHEDAHADTENTGLLLVGSQDDSPTPRQRMTRRAPDEDDDDRSTRSRARREAYRAARLSQEK
jgi:hypothetical protein